MSVSEQTTNQHNTDQNESSEPEARWDGAAQVVGFSGRVAGRVPARLDLRFAGTPERQLGLSLGMVLVYLRSYYTAQIVAQSWAEAAPLARSLAPLLVGRRRGIMTTGPWSVAAMVQLGGAPKVTGGLIEARPGSEAPTMLRLRVGRSPSTCVTPRRTRRC